jgi:hypothetical protein
MLGNKIFTTKLLYRGSRDGWKAVDFHRMSDGKGPTLTLFYIEDGDCFGGYTEAKWSSPEKE